MCLVQACVCCRPVTTHCVQAVGLDYTSRERVWEHLLSCHAADLARGHHSRLAAVTKQLARHGVPPRLRGEVWWRCCGATRLPQRHAHDPGLFRRLAGRVVDLPAQTKRHITADLPRTMPFILEHQSHMMALGLISPAAVIAASCDSTVSAGDADATDDSHPPSRCPCFAGFAAVAPSEEASDSAQLSQPLTVGSDAQSFSAGDVLSPLRQSLHRDASSNDQPPMVASDGSGGGEGSGGNGGAAAAAPPSYGVDCESNCVAGTASSGAGDGAVATPNKAVHGVAIPCGISVDSSMTPGSQQGGDDLHALGDDGEPHTWPRCKVGFPRCVPIAGVRRVLVRGAALALDCTSWSVVTKFRGAQVALALHLPSVGYVQGFNFVVSLLLMWMCEERAFWVTAHIVATMQPRGYYTGTMVGALVDQRVIHELVEQVCCHAFAPAWLVVGSTHHHAVWANVRGRAAGHPCYS